LAADLISKSLQKYGPGLVELRKIEASREIAQTLSQTKNVTYLPSNGSNVLMNLGSQ
jgi:prohibitin 1